MGHILPTNAVTARLLRYAQLWLLDADMAASGASNWTQGFARRRSAERRERSEQLDRARARERFCQDGLHELVQLQPSWRR
jgi:hypothetical protein